MGKTPLSTVVDVALIYVVRHLGSLANYMLSLLLHTQWCSQLLYINLCKLTCKESQVPPPHKRKPNPKEALSNFLWLFSFFYLGHRFLHLYDRNGSGYFIQ